MGSASAEPIAFRIANDRYRCAHSHWVGFQPTASILDIPIDMMRIPPIIRGRVDFVATVS